MVKNLLLLPKSCTKDSQKNIKKKRSGKGFKVIDGETGKIKVQLPGCVQQVLLRADGERMFPKLTKCQIFDLRKLTKSGD